MTFNNNEYRPNSFGYLPVVTKNIIIINIIAFAAKLLLQMRGISLDDYLSLHHHLAPSFKPHQFITYLFMHGSFMHILFNMFGVYIFGQVLEQVWGPKRYLIFYILTGLGAAVVQYMLLHFEITAEIARLNSYFDQDLTVAEQAQVMNYKYEFIQSLDRGAIMGASGSLFGLLGGFGMLFPNRYLYLYFFFPIKAKWLVIGYGALEIISGLRNNPGDNVAHFAHIGGLVVGVILVLAWRKNREHFY